MACHKIIAIFIL